MDYRKLNDDTLELVSKARRLLTREAFTERNVAFLRVANPEFKTKAKKLSRELLAIVNDLINFDESVDFKEPEQGEAAPNRVEFESAEDLADRYGQVTLALDGLLETIDKFIDKNWTQSTREGNKRPYSQVDGDSANHAESNQPRNIKVSGGFNINMQNAARLPKPQFSFTVPVDNSSLTAWCPKLKSKPNAKLPLSEFMGGHPYAPEINAAEYPSFIFQKSEPVLYRGFSETPFVYIDRLDDFEQMLSDIAKVDLIAVDIENHSLRSYQGFACLIQISTRAKDYIVDAIALRDHMQLLNDTFTNPAVLKVFHGAQSDVTWLQRDFSVYIVNLFDTFYASKQLQLDRHGLIHLMQRYCPDDALDEQAKKSFQMSDWRMRPLHQSLLDYARSDTHYLLYIFDNLKNELLDASDTTLDKSLSPMAAVLENSRKISLLVYEKPYYNFETGTGCGWKRELMKHGGSVLNEEQQLLFKAVHQWRDNLAREEDESPFFLMTTQSILSIVQKKPEDVAGVLSCCRPATPVMRRNAASLAQLVKKVVAEFRDLAEQRKALEENAKRELAQIQDKTATHTVYSAQENNLSKDIEGLWGEFDDE